MLIIQWLRKETAAISRIVQLANANGIGLTPHRITIARVYAVDRINATFTEMQSMAGWELNPAFKEVWLAGPKLRYADYIHGRKPAMIEALAAQSN